MKWKQKNLKGKKIEKIIKQISQMKMKQRPISRAHGTKKTSTNKNLEKSPSFLIQVTDYMSKKGRSSVIELPNEAENKKMTMFSPKDDWPIPVDEDDKNKHKYRE